MRNFIKDKVIKRILIIFVMIVMTTNFIMPNYIYAKTEPVETVSNALFYLCAKLGDVLIGSMQLIMVGTNDIGGNAGAYFIRYSPGMIFANKILALDINFLNPKSETIDRTFTALKDETQIANSIYDPSTDKTYEAGINERGSLKDFDADKFKNDVDYAKQIVHTYFAKAVDMSNVSMTKDPDDSNTWVFTVGKTYFIECKYNYNIYGYELNLYSSAQGSLDEAIKLYLNQYGYYDSGTIVTKSDKNSEYIWITTDGSVYSCRISNVSVNSNSKHIQVIKQENSSSVAVELGQISSPAYALQKNIATWYKALRTIAIVGLLSVLIYIGIRIIVNSSSAQEKSKYKNMLKDWVVAICLIFVLHYIMAFLLEITVKANDIIQNNVASSNAYVQNYDSLMSKIRTDIGTDLKEAVKSDNVAANTIMYLALVILTGMFTIQYLKRVVMMAFLTMIAPMIALTYPLDKLKDSKAQAFEFWLKEYIFNCVIQPVHLLLYTVLITNAGDFAQSNFLYAIVTLAFMVPAEKLIKEMFGIRSKTSSGTLGAAAGGALVMSMMNKLKSKSPKSDKEGQAPSGVRTATRTPSSDGAAVVPQNQVPITQNASVGGTKMATAKTGTGGIGSGAGSGQKTNSTQQQTGTNNNGSSTAQKKNKYSFARGLGEITGVNSLISAPGRTFKNAGTKLVKAGGALGMATMAGSFMLANEIADGHLLEDPEGALSKTGGAAVAGYMAGKSIEGGVRRSI